MKDCTFADMDKDTTQLELYKQSYDVVNKLRAIFRSKTLTKETAREKLHDWYKIVNRHQVQGGQCAELLPGTLNKCSGRIVKLKTQRIPCSTERCV